MKILLNSICFTNPNQDVSIIVTYVKLSRGSLASMLLLKEVMIYPSS